MLNKKLYCICKNLKNARYFLRKRKLKNKQINLLNIGMTYEIK